MVGRGGEPEEGAIDLTTLLHAPPGRPPAAWRDAATVYLNGRRHRLRSVHPKTTLLQYIREQAGLTGTKLSCGQGGCGACAVALTRWDSSSARFETRAVNACLRPVLSCDGMAVTTVEGLGRTRAGGKLHPIQQRLGDCNGAQCGFCTPGQVMAIYGMLKAVDQPSTTDVLESLDGNLCRCTGYAPIHAAANSFVADPEPGLHSKQIEGYNYPPADWAPYTAECDPPTPAELEGLQPSPLRIESEDGFSWYSVTCAAELSELVSELTGAGIVYRLVNGNTSTGVYGAVWSPCAVIDISQVGELHGLRLVGDGLRVGAGVTLSALRGELVKHPEQEGWSRLGDTIRHVANTNVRNAGSLAGNLMMHKLEGFPSDLATLLVALGASIEAISLGEPEPVASTMSLRDFFQQPLQQPVLVASILIPFGADDERFVNFRSSIRPVNSHALVNAAFRVTLSQDALPVLSNPMVVYGAVGTKVVVASAMMEAVDGEPLNQATLEKVLAAAATIPIEPDEQYRTALHPEGKDSYRRSLISVFAYKWFSCLMAQTATGLPASLVSSTVPLPYFEPSSSSEVYETKPPQGHPGATYIGPKREIFEITSGEQRYSGDMPMHRGLYACFVTATRGPAKLVSIDTAAALEIEGAVSFVGSDDIQGVNSSSFVPTEEPLFCAIGQETLFPGTLLGLMVAETQRAAEAAAAAVQVTYADPAKPGVYTMEQALANNSRLNGAPDKQIHVGDADKAWATPGLITVEGDFVVSGANHFYMEKHTAVACPEEFGRIRVYGGNQCPGSTVGFIAAALNVPISQVQLENRPMGGAFGGKFTKQLAAHCGVAVACQKLGQPVCLAMDIETDMGISGETRHPVKVHYKVGVDADGRFVVFDNSILADCGCANDYSDYIVDEILKRQDGAYHIPNYRCKATLLKTSNPSNTPVRAPEIIIDAVARQLGISQESVREINIKTAEQAYDMTGQRMLQWIMPAMWEQFKSDTGFAQRLAAVESFNQANRWRKRGLAMMPLKYAANYINLSGATTIVNVNAPDGSVVVRSQACEMGQGGLTKVLAAVAATLGVPMDMVTAYHPDTSVQPNMMTDGASTGSEIMVESAVLACKQILDRLIPVREQLTKEKPGETLEWKDVTGRAFGPMPTDTRVLMSATGFYTQPGSGGIDVTPSPIPWWDLDPQPALWKYYASGAACSEIELDVLTGEVVVTQADILYDAGTSLNPVLDMGQAEGAFVMGIGHYLREEPLLDPLTGENKCQGTWEYKPPSNHCVPLKMNVKFVKDSCNTETLFGSKGIGEPPICLAFTVISALRKAILASRLERGLGCDFRLDNPATVDRVQQALEVRESDLSLQ